MSTILAIDYGKKHIGLAVSEGWLIDPLPAIQVTSDSQALKKICQIMLDSETRKIVIGLPSGHLRPEIEDFGKKLEQLTGVTVYFQPEELSSKIARYKAKTGGKRLKSLGTQEHSLAAGVILEDFLAENPVKN